MPAVLAAERNQSFISDSLDAWRKATKPSKSELALANLIANVACREALSLDYALRAIAGEDALKLKQRQRVVFRVALSQYLHCTRIPVYAIVQDSVELAKKYGGKTAFGGFANAILRKLPPEKEGKPRCLPKPMGDSLKELSILYSLPLPFACQLVKEVGISQAREVMEAANVFPAMMARSRPGVKDDSELSSVMKVLPPSEDTPHGLLLPIKDDALLPYQVLLVPADKIPQVAKNPSYYIMNGTPALLLASLSHGFAARQGTSPPSTPPPPSAPLPAPLRVLDMCSSPGGKGLAVWDALVGHEGREVELTMNDVNERKVESIRQNLAKYQLEEGVRGQGAIRLNIGDGTALKAGVGNITGGYDLVIIDAPCSNTGVLNRRVEARWRIGPQAVDVWWVDRLDDASFVEGLMAIQKALLGQAVTLLSDTNPQAEIWYMTCSILANENQGLVEEMCRELDLEVVSGLGMTVLPSPTKHWWDGGFAACLRRKKRAGEPPL